MTNYIFNPADVEPSEVFKKSALFLMSTGHCMRLAKQGVEYVNIACWDCPFDANHACENLLNRQIKKGALAYLKHHHANDPQVKEMMKNV